MTGSEKYRPMGHLPVSTWRIVQRVGRCDICCSFIEEGFPYLEDEYIEECQNFCIPCAVKYNRNFTTWKEVKT